MLGRRPGGQEPSAARVPRERRSRRARRAESASNAAAATGALGPDAFISWFVAAAENSDLDYLRKRDPKIIRMGIEIWERVTGQGLLAGTPPESLTAVHITVANLYERRHELDGHRQDLDRAFSYLKRAAQHVIPGSDEDGLTKMSSANWLALRFQRTADRSDLDQSIEQYREAIGLFSPGTSNLVLATGALGQVLLSRHRLTGSASDLLEAQQLLAEATAKIGSGHPAAPVLIAELFSSLEEDPGK